MTDASTADGFRAISLGASLTVKDVQRSMAWYTDVLGFAIEQQHERDGKLHGVSLRAGDVGVLLNQEDGAKGWDRVKGEGLSFMFTTRQNIDDVAKRVTDHGGTLGSEPADMPWGARVFRITDPDGFKLVISSEFKRG
jgi:uncharacterized glyoxalase superfamily protein PhnB